MHRRASCIGSSLSACPRVLFTALQAAGTGSVHSLCMLRLFRFSETAQVKALAACPVPFIRDQMGYPPMCREEIRTRGNAADFSFAVPSPPSPRLLLPTPPSPSCLQGFLAVWHVKSVHPITTPDPCAYTRACVGALTANFGRPEGEQPSLLGGVEGSAEITNRNNPKKVFISSCIRQQGDSRFSRYKRKRKGGEELTTYLFTMTLRLLSIRRERY